MVDTVAVWQLLYQLQCKWSISHISLETGTCGLSEAAVLINCLIPLPQLESYCTRGRVSHELGRSRYGRGENVFFLLQ